MRIYIAGKITGDKNYKRNFLKAERRLKKKGHSVMNPAWLVEYQGFTYSDYMDISDCMRRKCDAIFLLDNWMNSNGAQCERLKGINEEQTLYYNIDEVPVADSLDAFRQQVKKEWAECEFAPFLQREEE